MKCKFCNTEDSKNFELHESARFCDDCVTILDYYNAKAFLDLQTVYKERNRIGELSEAEFFEGLCEYAEKLGESYNEKLREERENGK